MQWKELLLAAVYYIGYIQSGWSALMAAVYKGYDDVALRIIQAGATPHLQDKVSVYIYIYRHEYD